MRSKTNLTINFSLYDPINIWPFHPFLADIYRGVGLLTHMPSGSTFTVLLLLGAHLNIVKCCVDWFGPSRPVNSLVLNNNQKK